MAKTYDLSAVVCTVGSVGISGYGENDAVGFEWDEEIVTHTPTADGDQVYSRNNNRGLTVSVTVHQKSRAHLLLWGLIEAQHGDNLGVHPTVITPLTFYLLDPSNGETIAGECVMMARPAPSKGKTIGEVVYKLHMPNPKVTGAVLNVI